MEGAGFGEAELGGDVADGEAGVGEQRDGEVAAQVVEDAAVGLAFVVQPAAQGGFRGVEL